MMKQKLYPDIPNYKIVAVKRLIIFALTFMLIFVISYNVKSFLRVWNIYNYDAYLQSLYKLKKEKGLQAVININNDCFAYLSCEDLNVHLPIVKLTEKSQEEYYLSHDFLKRENELGSPYQKFGTELNQTTNTTFVGHSAYIGEIFHTQKSRTIFGRFGEYLYEDANYNHIITIETLDNTYRYKVVSVMKFNTRSGNPKDELSVYGTVNLNTESEFNDYVDILRKKSWVSKNLAVPTYGDKFITIYTCATDNLNYRVMVVAKLI